MAQANRYTGKDMVILIGDTVISSEYQSLKVKEGVESAEATAGSDLHEYSIPTYATSEVEVELFGVNKTSDTYEDIREQTSIGATGPLVWHPEGVGGGGTKPIFTATGYVKDREEEYTFKDAVTLKFKFVCTARIDGNEAN